MNIVSYIAGLRRLPFVRDVLTIQAGSLVLMIAGFAVSVIYARVLGPEEYGLYAVTLAFAGTVSALFNIGQGQSLYVFLSESYAKKDSHAMAAVLKNFLVIACVNVLLLLLLALIIPLLGSTLYGRSDIGTFAQIMCLFQITDLWNSATLTIMQSVRRIRPKVLLEQAANLSFMGLSVLAVLMGYGVGAIVIVQLAVSAFFVLLSIIALRDTAIRYNLPTPLAVLRVPWKESSQYFFQGLVMTLDKTIGNFFPQGLYFLFSLLVPKSAVGMVKIAVQLAMIPRSILLPQAGDLSVTGFARLMQQGMDSVRAGAKKLILHALGLQVVLSLCSVLILPFIVRGFYGPAYEGVIHIAIALTLILVLQALCIANGPVLRLLRKMQYSILGGIAGWILMIGTLLILAENVPSTVAFIAAFLAGQISPLIVTWYLFHSLLKPQPLAS